MPDFNHPTPVEVIVTSSEQLRAVYAVLANPNIADAVNVGLEFRRRGNAVGEPVSAKPDITQPSAGATTLAQESPEADGTGPTATTDASLSELDSGGLPFDPATMTGTKLKTGQWRMKNGVERPSVPASAAVPEAEEASLSAGGAGTETVAAASPPSDDDDEFAAFREAAAASPETKPSAEGVTPEVPARSWTDADLSALTNQAASKMGATEVPNLKAIIARFCPEGTVAHSRHVPADQREALAQEIEKWADIEFAG